MYLQTWQNIPFSNNGNVTPPVSSSPQHGFKLPMPLPGQNLTNLGRNGSPVSASKVS